MAWDDECSNRFIMRFDLGLSVKPAVQVLVDELVNQHVLRVRVSFGFMCEALELGNPRILPNIDGGAVSYSQSATCEYIHQFYGYVGWLT